MTRKDLTGIFFLFFFSLVMAFLYNHFSASGLALYGQWKTSKGVVSALSKTGDINPDIQINNPELIKQIVQDKTRIVLDVRPREVYNQGHLPGALSFPLIEFDQQVFQMLDSINKQEPLLVYCSSIECTDSHTVAQRLTNLGYVNVMVFSGGFRQWQEKGYEIKKNDG